jgi:hypothetical protein
MQETFLQLWRRPNGFHPEKRDTAQLCFWDWKKRRCKLVAAPIKRADTLWARFGSKLKPPEWAPEPYITVDGYRKENRSKNRPPQPDFGNTISD